MDHSPLCSLPAASAQELLIHCRLLIINEQWWLLQYLSNSCPMRRRSRGRRRWVRCWILGQIVVLSFLLLLIMF